VRLKENRWRRTGEGTELVDHVGLVIEADVQGHRRPPRDVGGEQGVHERLKASDARKQFRWQPGSGTESTGELAATEAVAPHHTVDGDEPGVKGDEPRGSLAYCLTATRPTGA